MTKFLCIDTSAGSAVALVEDGEVLARDYSADPRAHAEHLAGMIRKVCGVNDNGPLLGRFNVVVVGRGPAPYTGLRAGLITARVLAKATGAALYGLSSLEILGRSALGHVSSGEVMACSDARRKEVYAAHLTAVGEDDIRLLGDYLVAPATEVAAVAEEAGVPAAGPGADLYAEAFSHRLGEVQLDVAAAARIVSARLVANPELELGTEPLYLRRPDVHMPKAGQK
ncbi:tRNA (adenosine(37)-N6)-threonylcarbamoyltransferase complex dimerization subunit type 1 TsaB [Boudabousia marimammalium]|uniref:tRNA (Adenosine(37)-N6)-threonylcarbamoyltransferase complex dimerization subunit type 1 TsaB n=1 Tax=Boudabousia marimammalium TaxID=156892 RepID=A0A1Q5PJK2_9ACTO|nr:tRNA (adenosine(37)-N6)-threonylcarbamoyltransferase complex dimerization subunit type 1 TsaB [Boudabousia marimammalium]OKL46055.1 tRNA (adenosine(37)-N6)-threonylcarbamoyltransferase complex dimerization subunit type 1 TsaB [Boudabousia marimammalium]